MYQLSDLREAVRHETGLPELGQQGRDRAKKMLQNCLNELWGQIPEVFLRAEHELRMEPPLMLGTLTVHPTDPRVFIRLDTPIDVVADGTLNARWLEVERDGRIYRRRIQKVYVGPYEANDALHLVVDEPWDNNTDANLTYRIHTYEYPLPAETQAIREVIIAREQYPTTVTIVACQPEELERLRMARGWKVTARPWYYARGDFAQLQGPHFSPEVSRTAAEDPALFWGHDDAGVERGSAYVGGKVYGAAGTFSYRCVLVHGRHKFQNPLGDGKLKPFLVSAPTAASDRVATTWGGPAIRITSPDQDYVRGFGDDPTMPSYHKSGIEKWWFRARHATESPAAAGNHALVKQIEADGQYYLWRITQGHVTEIYDKGDDDPVDRQYPLRDFAGHHTLRFDVAPDAEYRCLVMLTRRPPVIEDETDAVNIPPEFTDLLVYKVCAKIARRDKDYKAAGGYEKKIVERIDALRQAQSLARISVGGFGQGLGPARPIASTMNWQIRST